MGFLGILKKKEATAPSGLTPIDKNPNQINDEISKYDDIPPIQDIPLPPGANNKENMNTPTPKDDFPKEDNPELETPIKPAPIKQNSEALAEPEEINGVPIPPVQKEADSDLEVKPGEEIPKPESNFDFELPDFTEEELNISKEVEEFEEEEKEYEAEKAAKKEAVKKIPEVSANPLVKDEVVSKGVEHYMKVSACYSVFEEINLSHDKIKNIEESIQQNEVLKKNKTQNYKVFHDNMDLAQENLMQIDRTLFER